MNKIKVAIDNGHGLNTAGKRTPEFQDGTQIREWQFNFPTAQKLGELLDYNGFDVLYVSPTEADLPLSKRTDAANAWKADIFVSVHYNAYNGVWGTHGGTETFHYKGSEKGQKLANLIQKEVVSTIGLRDRGIKTDSLHVTRETKMPAALVEYAFMDNSHEAGLMLNEDHQWKCAKATAKAVCNYFEKEFKEQGVTEKEWREAQGMDALFNLQKKGDIVSPEYWGKIMMEPMPTWAALTLFDRLSK